MVVQTVRLTKRYKNQPAVNEVSISLLKDEVVALMGPNGAGKSTLLKMLIGLLNPTRGEIYFQGKPLAQNSNRAKRQIGYLPEGNPLYVDLYVREFLCFVGSIFKAHGAQIEETIDKVGLRREQHKKIRQLSKGYRQRVGLAQVLLHNPDFLILDEPTSGLDPVQIIGIQNLIKELGTARTVLLSTHYIQEVEAIADRVLILNEGKLAADFYIADCNGKLETHFKGLSKKIENGQTNGNKRPSQADPQGGEKTTPDFLNPCKRSKSKK